MDRLEQLKFCMLNFNSKYTSCSQESFKQIHQFLNDWNRSDTVVEDCIQLLSKETNESILFYSIRALCDFYRSGRYSLLKEQQIIDIGNFISELVLRYISNESAGNSYISSKKESNDITFFRFYLICIADSCAFSKGNLLLRDICSNLPIEISLRICTFFFEDWNLYINLKWPVVNDDIEFTLGILREVPASVDWLPLYSAFAEYVLDLNLLSEFLPKLHELINIPDVDNYSKLSDHIETILNIPDVLQFSSYSYVIFQFSLEFAKRLRDLVEISLTKNDVNAICEFSNQLTFLWSVIISFNDESDSIFREDVVPLLLDLLKEFTIVESVLMAAVQITQDIELWPKLIDSMAKFGEVFNGKEPYHHYTTNIIEFILFGGSIGVDLTESQTQYSLCQFYGSNSSEINAYLANPTQNVPAILTFLSIIAKNNKTKNILPSTIPLMYLENIDFFNSSPKDVIYFSLTFVEQLNDNEKCVEKFCQLFCLYFQALPYECAKGFYKISNINRKFYYELNVPQLLYENYQKVSFFEESNEQGENSNWDGEIITSKSPLIYMLPCIITDQIDLIINDPQNNSENKPDNNEITQKLMNRLNEIASHIFDALIQSQSNGKQFLLFLNVISSVFTLMGQGNEIIKRFCSLIFQQIMQTSQQLWLYPSVYIQNSLSFFVISSFLSDFVNDSASAVASWLNQVILIAPVEYHFKIPKFLLQFFNFMPNLFLIIQNSIMPQEIPETHQARAVVNPDIICFALTCLNTFVDDFDTWQESFFILFPPQLLLTLASIIEDEQIYSVLNALNKIIDSGKASNEFIEQLLLVTLNEYRKDKMNTVNLEIIRKICKIVGEDNVVQACNSLCGNESKDFGQLIEDIMNPAH
ncbi:hypothetical protein M9Y10_009893 [Tritrichomonas musculus]|uniref:Exportin-1/Importin-beta-like domain-containing protein n=1 Tax=Tritrichomonas musculus TaxID=1915356 RepID=A0ABR2IPP0_9EUKA